MQEETANPQIERTERLPKYSTIESIVELETQEDDANKENETDDEREGYTGSFKNKKLPVTKEVLEDITNKRLLSDNVIHRMLSIFFVESSLSMLQDFKTLYLVNPLIPNFTK